MEPALTVTVVGAGLSGAACAAELVRGGASVRVVERGRAPGGRMASPSLHARRVDVGAGYFTVRDPEFGALVERWSAAGLVRPWTDTFAVLAPGSEPSRSSGPLRYGTADGLRSLVRAVLDGLDVELGSTWTAPADGPTVLAMPDPQAARIVGAPRGVAWLDYDPVIAVVSGFARRHWDFDAAFVNDHPDLAFLADDGTRRGDGAPVLVAHSSAALARRHLERPQDAVEPVLAAVRELLGGPAPEWTHVHRWSLAKPAGQHDTTHHLSGDLGLCGDQWCPAGSPRIESAWRSGTDLARALLARG